jgi:hypothetical protein
LPTLEDCRDAYDEYGECPLQLCSILLFPHPGS